MVEAATGDFLKTDRSVVEAHFGKEMFVPVFGGEPFLEHVRVGVEERQQSVRKLQLSGQSAQHIRGFLHGQHISEYLIDNVRLGVFVVRGRGSRLRAGGFAVFRWSFEFLSSMSILKHLRGCGVLSHLSFGRRCLRLVGRNREIFRHWAAWKEPEVTEGFEIDWTLGSITPHRWKIPPVPDRRPGVRPEPWIEGGLTELPRNYFCIHAELYYTKRVKLRLKPRFFDVLPSDPPCPLGN